MKKTTLMSITAAFGILIFAMPALAATTASLVPSSLKIAAGQQFNVAVTVNPNGTGNYAEKLEINYPADLLEVVSFNLGGNWMALNQPGYDSIDNVRGVVMKTAGYAGGITSATPFGTIGFKAKKSGSGTIAVGNGSQAFESGGQTAIVGTGASFIITSSTIAPQREATTAGVTLATANADTADLTPVISINGEVVPASSTQSAIAAAAVSQVAAVAVPVEYGGNVWMWIASIVLVATIGAYFIFRKNKTIV